MQTFLKPFKKLAGRVLLGLKPLALRARGFKPNKTLDPARFLNSTLSTDKTDNLTCKIIYDNFTCENYRFSIIAFL